MSKRSGLATQATETVAICDAGQYESAGGNIVTIKDTLQRAVKGTVVYSAENLPALPPPSNPVGTKIEVANETTFRGLVRLSARGGHIGCLNFASARNPGGGFLTGAQAQEEALARASGLYPCLQAAPEYYEKNRANRSAVYLDLVIFSP